MVVYFLSKCEKWQSLLSQKCLALKRLSLINQENKYFKIQTSLFQAGQINLNSNFIWPARKSEFWILKYLFPDWLKSSLLVPNTCGRAKTVIFHTLIKKKIWYALMHTQFLLKTAKKLHFLTLSHYFFSLIDRF